MCPVYLGTRPEVLGYNRLPALGTAVSGRTVVPMGRDTSTGAVLSRSSRVCSLKCSDRACCEMIG